MRLIDADKLMERLEEKQRIFVENSAYRGGLAGAGVLIAEAPTVAMGDDYITINWTPDIDRLARDVAYRGLNEFSYMGKSIREWAEIILEQEAPVWVSVKDRLPDKKGIYLARLSDGVYRILGYSLNLHAVDEVDFHEERPGWYEYDEYGYCEVTDVTHWRLLPEPPEVVSGDA